MSGLKDDPILQSGRTGIAYGSGFGSTAPLAEFTKLRFSQENVRFYPGMTQEG